MIQPQTAPQDGRFTLTLPQPWAAPSLSHWEREGARPAQPGGKGEGEGAFA